MRGGSLGKGYSKVMALTRRKGILIFYFLTYKIYVFFIEIYLFYNIMLVADIQHNNPDLSIFCLLFSC